MFNRGELVYTGAAMSCLHLPQGKSDASPGCLELSGYLLFCSLAIFVSQLTVLKTFLCLRSLSRVMYWVLAFMYHEVFHLIIRFNLL